MPKEATSAQVSEAKPTAPALSRRERVREATLVEIKSIARSHLAAQGVGGVSLRAVAREMGMTAPGLYRYFASLDDLLMALQADFFTELSGAVTSANEALPEDDVDGRIMASIRAFRGWALANRAEFTLLFGPPSPHHSCPHEGAAMEAGRRFASTFFALFDQLLQQERFPLPDPATLSPTLCRQLQTFAQVTGFSSLHATEGALRVLTSCWVRLYGLVCMEVFQHMGFIMDDMEPLFEAEMRDVFSSLGVRYRPPEHGNTR